MLNSYELLFMMKRVLTVRRCSFVFFALLLASYVSYPQWEIQNSGVSATLRDVCFVDSLYGWAVGDSGTIITTVDGGKSWLRKIEPVDSVEFRQVQFLTRDIGFVGGNRRLPSQQTRHAIVLQTTNGGLNWERCDSTFGSDFVYRAMEFLDPDNGWLAINNFYTSSVASRGILLKTTNGGRSWSVLQEDDSLRIGAFAFFNTEQGYSFWTPFYDNFDATDVYATQDGGKAWKWTGRIEMQTIVKAKCLSPDTLWARGWNISRSQDGGKTWKTWNWSNPVFEGQKRFFAGDFEVLNSNNVWLVGNARYTGADVEGVLLRTSNSGDSWWSELEVPDRSFGGLSVTSGKEAWIVGSNGLIMHLKNNVTGIRKEVDGFDMPFEVEQNYPNPFNSGTSIHFNLLATDDICIRIYDIRGKMVVELLSQVLNPGPHAVFWDGKDRAGQAVPSGVYFYQLTGKSIATTRKALLIR